MCPYVPYVVLLLRIHRASDKPIQVKIRESVASPAGFEKNKIIFMELRFNMRLMKRSATIHMKTVYCH